MNKHVMLVFSNAMPGRDDLYNAWQDEQHIPQVTALPGFDSGVRYELAESQRKELPDRQQRYLAVYELNTSPSECYAQLAAAIGPGDVSLSDTIDPTSVVSFTYTQR